MVLSPSGVTDTLTFLSGWAAPNAHSASSAAHGSQSLKLPRHKGTLHPFASQGARGLESHSPSPITLCKHNHVSKNVILGKLLKAQIERRVKMRLQSGQMTVEAGCRPKRKQADAKIKAFGEYISLQVLKKMWYFPPQTKVMFFLWVISKKIFVSSSLCIYPIFFFPPPGRFFAWITGRRRIRFSHSDLWGRKQLMHPHDNRIFLCAHWVFAINQHQLCEQICRFSFFFFKAATIIILKRASKYENCAVISSPAFPHWPCSRSPRWSSGLEIPLTHIHTHRAQRRDPL